MARFAFIHDPIRGLAIASATFLLTNCDPKNKSSRQETAENLAKKIEEKLTVAQWTNMELLAEGHWSKIENSTEISWNDENQQLQLAAGYDLNGVRWTGDVPKPPFVLELEARRINGSDFFCGLTFPVRDGNQHVTLIVGGWGGNLVGISSIQNLDASENSTASYHEFENNRWYEIRIHVEQEHIQAWIDKEEVVDVYTDGQSLSLRPGPIEACLPLGIASWNTEAEIRSIRWKSSDEPK